MGIFKTLTVPGDNKQLSATLGATAQNRRRKDIQSGLKRECQNFQLLLTSYKSGVMAEVIETLLRKFRAIEELVHGLVSIVDADTRDETMNFSKHLSQISDAYERSKDRLNRDLNKMEFQVGQIRDTRDRMQMKHIKSLDNVQQEINRIMPNDLSSHDDEPDMEDIKRDLESEDIFALKFPQQTNAEPIKNATPQGNLMPEEEWLQSSDPSMDAYAEQIDTDLDATGAQSLKEMEQ